MAENLLAEAAETPIPSYSDAKVARAQVYATLAVAAATVQVQPEWPV